MQTFKFGLYLFLISLCALTISAFLPFIADVEWTTLLGKKIGSVRITRTYTLIEMLSTGSIIYFVVIVFMFLLAIHGIQSNKKSFGIGLTFLVITSLVAISTHFMLGQLYDTKNASPEMILTGFRVFQIGSYGALISSLLYLIIPKLDLQPISENANISTNKSSPQIKPTIIIGIVVIAMLLGLGAFFSYKTFIVENISYGIITSRNGLFMRSKPSTKGEKVITIPSQTKIEIIDENGPSETLYGITSNWYKVEYKNQTGWVFGGFIQKK